MKILFLLPGGAGAPVGGVKVVLEYANRLVADGYEVGVVYPSYCRGLHWIGIFLYCKAVIRFLAYFLIKRYSCRTWFPLDARVKEYWVWSLDERWVPKADVYVATAVQTAYYLTRYKKVSSNLKFYLIQGFEDWGNSNREYLLNSYHFPLHKFVIANWLRKIIEKENESCTLIPNGFDFSQFHITIPLEKRKRYKVCMLYHKSQGKGCADGFKALEIVKRRCSDLRVTLFGVPSRPEGLPEWYEYYQRPSREVHTRLYNEAAIFLGTSHSEGWGLTVGEAMACGCAVVCTDNPGYLEMAEDGKTALVAPVADYVALANNILRLMKDDALRVRIAYEGNKNILRFTWDSSYSILREEIEKGLRVS
ncbi:MAG: glycosyltransferase family 4 protein [Bacteroidaceae bacterium]|jgi:glycosyltransferase involved in cell wall biosynthesis